MPYVLANRDPRQLKRDVRNVVLGVAAFLMTISVVSVVVFMVALFATNPQLLQVNSLDATSFDFAEYEEQIYDALLYVMTEYAGLASIIGMLCGLLWFFIFRGRRFLTTDVTRVNSRIKVSTLLLLFAFILGVQFFMTLLQIGMLPFSDQGTSAPTDVLDDSMGSLATSFWGILYIAILGPICEELVFRGAIMRNLERYGANFAMIVSSLLFGLYHIILFQAVFAFFVGLILAYTAGRFSLKWAILLHIANNGMAVLSYTFNSELFDAALMICYFVGFVTLIIVFITQRKMFTAQKIAGAPSEAQVYSRAFSSPWLIVYIVLCVLGGIQVQLLGVI